MRHLPLTEEKKSCPLLTNNLGRLRFTKKFRSSSIYKKNEVDFHLSLVIRLKTQIESFWLRFRGDLELFRLVGWWW